MALIYLWNSIQNILPIHWKINLLWNIEILRALRVKSSYAFLKRPPGHLDIIIRTADIFHNKPFDEPVNTHCSPVDTPVKCYSMITPLVLLPFYSHNMPEPWRFPARPQRSLQVHRMCDPKWALDKRRGYHPPGHDQPAMCPGNWGSCGLLWWRQPLLGPTPAVRSSNK